jgi:TetR/AcrR family transcriptional regulator
MVADERVRADPASASAVTAAPVRGGQSTRSRLLQAGIELLRRRGVASVSVGEVPLLAGVSKPMLYYHFGSKQGFLNAILEDGAGRLAATARKAATRRGLCRERIVSLCEDMCELFEREPYLLDLAGRPDSIRSLVAAEFDFTPWERQINGAFERILLAGQATGEFRVEDPVAVRFVFVSVVLGAARQRHRDQVSVARLLQPVLRCLLPADGEYPGRCSGDDRHCSEEAQHAHVPRPLSTVSASRDD